MTRPRRGYSLIEMLLVIACLTILLGVGVATLQALFRVEQTTRSARDEDRAIDRLAAAFRADVHRATGRGDGPAGAVVLKLPPGERVEYRVEGASLVMARSRSDGPPRTERLRLRWRGSPRLSWVEHDGRAFARLLLPRAEGGAGLCIEAALGLGRRPGDEEEQP